ncbi:MAG: M48 family metalloprotease [Spirochaetota bacterium]|nr:M48 family metalloprotease [Spirochaetota bacterium]
MKHKLLILISLTLIFSILKCSYNPPKEEIDKKNEEIGLYEEWLMGLIALKNLGLPLANPRKTLNKREKQFQLMLKKLHYSAVNLGFWREPYRSPEVMVFRTRRQNAFTLPGGFICITTGLINLIDRKAKKNSDQVIASILAHELVHLYLEHPKRHYITMLLKDNIGRQYREMAEGIQAAAGDFTSDYSKLLIKTILKAKEAGTKGYQAEMEFDADVKAVQILSKAGYNPNALITALGLMKHHMGGVHGSFKDRVNRVKKAIKGLN